MRVAGLWHFMCPRIRVLQSGETSSSFWKCSCRVGRLRFERRLDDGVVHLHLQNFLADSAKLHSCEMEEARFRRISQSFHEGFSFRGGPSEMLISPPVQNQLQCYHTSDSIHPQAAFHPQFYPQLQTSYMQLMDSGNLSMVSKLDEIEAGRQSRSPDEVCRFDPIQEPAPLFNQARFSAQNSPISLLPDPDFMIEEIPNGLHSSESDNKPVQCPRSKNTKPKKPNVSGPRFRPNDAQKRLLEKHFRSGLAKPTPDLFNAVQQAGDATERQIAVWLKNRRSREKQGTKRVPKHELPDQELQFIRNKSVGAPEQACPIFASNMTHWVQPMEDFTSIMYSVVNELDLIVRHVDPHELENLCQSLMHAPQIVCHALGKEGHIMNKFASDLNNLGFQATSLNDTAILPVLSEDVFMVSAGPSCHSSVSSLCLEAIRMGACVIAFTAHRAADTLFTDFFVHVPGQTLTRALPGHQELSQPGTEFISFLPDGRDSVMNMGSSYEVGLSLVHASILMMLRQRMQKSILLR